MEAPAVESLLEGVEGVSHRGEGEKPFGFAEPKPFELSGEPERGKTAAVDQAEMFDNKETAADRAAKAHYEEGGKDLGFEEGKPSELSAKPSKLDKAQEASGLPTAEEFFREKPGAEGGGRVSEEATPYSETGDGRQETGASKDSESTAKSSKLDELRAEFGKLQAAHEGLTPKTHEWFESRRKMAEVEKEMRGISERETVGASAAASAKQQKGVTQYLIDTGTATAKALAQGAKLDAEITPGTKRALAQYIERSKPAPEKLAAVGDAISNEFDNILKAEHAKGINTEALGGAKGDEGENALGYMTHVTTSSAPKFFGALAKDKNAELEFLTKLEATRAGVDPSLVMQGTPGMAPFSEQRFERAGKMPLPGGRGSQEIPDWMRKDPAISEFFERQPEDVQAFMKRNSFKRAATEFANQITTFHENQIPRLAAFRDLSAAEINDAAGKEIFHENPAAALTVRKLRSVRSIGAVDFLDGAAEKLGKELGEVRPGTGRSVGDGVTEVIDKAGDKKYVIDHLDEIRGSTAGPRIGFDDPETAAAVREMYSKMRDREESSALGRFWDKTTSLYKAYMGRIFPAHQFQWWIGNKLQSWMGGVPLSTEEDTKVWKMLAGKPTEFNAPGHLNGKLSGDEMLELMKPYRIAEHGQLTEQIKDALELGKEKPSWNLLDPNNKFIDAGDRLSATVLAAPAALAAGAGDALKGARSSLLEAQTRARHFAYRIGQGWAPAAAAKDVEKYLFDYSRNSLSDFEKDYASRGIFYYTYMRKILPLVAQTAVESLNRLTPMAHLALQPGKPDYLPEYTKDSIVLPRGKDLQGNSKVMYDLGTPFESALSPFQENPINILNPIIKAPLEAASGRDFFLHKDIADARTAPHWVDKLPEALQEPLGVEHIPTKTGSRTEMNPWEAWALRESPLSRASNTASRLADERKTIGDKALNLFSGSRTVSVDDEEEAKRAQRAAIRARLKELEQQGRAREFTNYSAKNAEGVKDAEAAGLVRALK